jgi:hypothetical protein
MAADVARTVSHDSSPILCSRGHHESDDRAIRIAFGVTVDEFSALEIRQRVSSIFWRMTTFRWLLCGLVIAQWCFWDVTTTSILRPVQLEPVVTRLYNEMHYGRTESLMSLTVLSLLIPFALWGLLAAVTWLKAVVRPTVSDRPR